MYTKVEKRVEKFIRDNGEIRFKSVVEEGTIKTSENYIKHDVVYVYHSGSSDDKLAEFFLCTESLKKYLMGSFNLTRDYESGLRVFFFNMIVERAILEARELRAEELVIIGMEGLLVETFLNYGFRVRQVDTSIYKGIRNLKG